MATKLTHPPRYIRAVLDDLLTLMRESGRYEGVEGGRVEIGWIQRRKCYQVTLDFRECDEGDVDDGTA